MSFSTTFKYFSLFLADTKGTDQNCFVFVKSDNFQPKTKEYTPITSLNLTEFTYKVSTGKAGEPCVM